MSNTDVAMANSVALQVDGLVCLDVVPNSKGQKTASILCGTQEAFWLPGPMQVLFQPSAFQGAEGGRLSICFRASPEAIEAGTQLDSWAVQYATLHSERLFGKPLSAALGADRYTSVLKTSEKYSTSIRAKLSTEGRYAPTYWTKEKERRDAPTDFAGAVNSPRIRVASFWFMGGQFGVTLQLQSAMVQSEALAAECPF